MKKFILITGCSSGIGYRAAHMLQARGYDVIATARKEIDVKRLQDEGLCCIQLDINDSTSIKSAVNAVRQHTNGHLYALINNAGFAQVGAIEDLSRDAIRAQFETNVFGLMELTNYLIPVMREQGYGRIINVSSILGIITLPYRGAYNASKFALEGLTDTLRLELHNTGIHVSLIEPGPIESNFRNNALMTFKSEHVKETSPHQNNYQRMTQRFKEMIKLDPFTLSADAVVKKMIHALEKSRPKVRYRVTIPAYLFTLLKRVLPSRALDFVLQQVSRRETSQQ